MTQVDFEVRNLVECPVVLWPYILKYTVDKHALWHRIGLMLRLDHAKRPNPSCYLESTISSCLQVLGATAQNGMTPMPLPPLFFAVEAVLRAPPLFAEPALVLLFPPAALDEPLRFPTPPYLLLPRLPPPPLR